MLIMRSFLTFRSLKRHHGFTLLELLVVILILGVLGAVGVAGYRTELAAARNNAAATEFAGWLEAVRRSAERGIPCQVTVTDNPAATTASVIASSDLVLNGVTSKNVGNNCLTDDDFRIGSNLGTETYAVASTAPSFTFTPRGTVFVPGGGAIQISFNSENLANARCVLVTQPLGLISVVNCP